MKIRSTEDIAHLGTILSIWAHPDDETFLAGGIMAAAVRNGQKVICITATRGEAGSNDLKRWPLESIGEVRTKELLEGLHTLGVQQHHWLGYEDGCCEEIKKEDAVGKLKALISQYQPETILTFGKDGVTGHSDHCCVSCWVDDAIELSNVKPCVYHAVHTDSQYENYLKHMDKKMDIFFNIDEPPIVREDECDIFLALDDKLKTQKLRALAQMPSQMSIMFESFDESFLSDALASETFVLSK